MAQQTPASRPASDPVVAAQLLAAGKAALARQDAPGARQALRDAVKYDPSLAEAHYLLAKAYQASGRTQDATAEYQELIRLAGQEPKPAPALEKWKADAEAQLRVLLTYPREWDALRKDYGRKLRALPRPAEALPSTVQALEAAVLLAPDEALKQEVQTCRSQLPDVLPPAPDSPDRTAGKALLDQGRALLRAGKGDQAIEPLRSACGLSRDLETLTALAEAYHAAGKGREAAVVAAEAQRLLVRADERQRRTVEPSLANLLRRNDPNMVRLNLLLGQFAAQAEALATRATKAKDEDTAEEVLEVVLTLLPGREPAQTMMNRLGELGPMMHGLPNLTSNWVECFPSKNAAVQRTGRAFEIQGKAFEKDTVNFSANLRALQPGQSFRATWRVEVLSPPPPGEKYASFSFRFHCLGFSTTDGSGNDFLVGYLSSGTVVNKPTQQEATGMLKADNTYEVTCQKEGTSGLVKVDGRLLCEGQFTTKFEPTQYGLTMQLTALRLPHGHPFHAKLTLLDFACSPDCIGQKK